MLIRKPHVAGTFYPDDSRELSQTCESLIGKCSVQKSPRALILPHAGYIYSGRTAGRVLQQVLIPDDLILIGPNHWGRGAEFAMMRDAVWNTPLGEIPVNQELAGRLAGSSAHIKDDFNAHSREHSLEVELPLLYTKNPHIRIVPMIVGTLDLNRAREVAKGMAQELASYDNPVLTVVSTDMNHYESDEITRQKDAYALEAIRELDAEKLARAVTRQHISMCGFIPVYMLLCMKEELGLNKCELIHYATSAEVSGDTERVVGYAGFILE